MARSKVACMGVFINSLCLHKSVHIEAKLAGAWLTADSQVGENAMISLPSVSSHLKGRNHCAGNRFSKSTGRHVRLDPFPSEINGRLSIDFS